MRRTAVTIPQYQHFNWVADCKLGRLNENVSQTAPIGQTDPRVIAHPLWAFHNALAQCAVVQNTDNKPETRWALASLCSLIEIDINRDFVAYAGVAFEADCDAKKYTKDESSGLFRATERGLFAEYRAMTAPAIYLGDANKGDVLRTSLMHVGGFFGFEMISYHPHISFPTNGFQAAERLEKKHELIKIFYDSLKYT